MEVELCIPVRFPAELVVGPGGNLTEAGEVALNAIGAALDGYMRRSNSGVRQVMAAAGIIYKADTWRTRFPGPEGVEVLPGPMAGDDDDDESEA